MNKRQRRSRLLHGDKKLTSDCGLKKNISKLNQCTHLGFQSSIILKEDNPKVLCFWRFEFQLEFNGI